jgi:MSHA pilin protein MshA
MKRRSNFTLVEIIAVLLIIAIMAAVAAPKFINLTTEARQGVAQAGINEAKASLSAGLAKAYLTNAKAGTNTVTCADVMSAAGVTASNTFGDITVTAVADESTETITLTATQVGTATVTGVSDTWVVPTEYQNTTD